jgi:hypothetical protein
VDSIERAIRVALAKGDARDKSFRERVYRSVLAALERANAANPDLTPEAIEQRRAALKTHITSIEREFVAPAPAPASTAPAVEPPARPANDPAPQPPPQVEAAVRDEPAEAGYAASDDGFGVAADDRLSPEHDRPRRRRPIAMMFIAAIVLAAIAIGGWWAVQVGLLSNSEPADPAASPETESESFTPEPESGAVASGPRDWVTIFDMSDTSGVVAPAGATIEAVEDEDGTYLAIRSGVQGAAILFNVPEALLRGLAGNTVVFDIEARSEEGRETQISISCNFGELGDCGRKRYLVGYERSDYLFDVEMPAGAPGADGAIAIVSDVENEGKALHIFEIRAGRR